MDEKKVRLVPAADKTLKLLEYMALTDAVYFGVSELSKNLGYNKGTVHSILQTLISNQWVEQGKNAGKYNLTNKMQVLGGYMEREDRLVDEFLIVGAEMERKCGEMINLHYLKGMNKVRLVAKVPSTQNTLRVELPVGSNIPIVVSSAGKCLVCEWDDNYLSRVFQQCNGRYTEKTIKEEAVFLEQVHRAREKGYAINEAEYEEGIFSVAAPIRNRSGSIVAAINIVIPSVRYTPERKEMLVELVKNGALKLSNYRI